MRSAKDLFQSSPAYKDYQQMIASPAFEPACNAALLAMIEDMPQAVSEPSKSWDAHCQIVGARNLIQKLSELHVPDNEDKRQKWPELNYSVNKQRT